MRKVTIIINGSPKPNFLLEHRDIMDPTREGGKRRFSELFQEGIKPLIQSNILVVDMAKNKG